MTKQLSANNVAEIVRKSLPDAVAEADGDVLLVESTSLLDVARILKETPELDLEYLISVTGVDWYPNYFEVIYHLRSIDFNQSLVMKTKTGDRENPVVPSVVSVWYGASYQEREVYDLMGISFAGHPSLKRILLWDDFVGHPLRKDFVPNNL